MGFENKNSYKFRENIELTDTYVVIERTHIALNRTIDIFNVYSSYDSFEADESPIDSFTEISETTSTDVAAFDESYKKVKKKYTNTKDKKSDKEKTKDQK